VERGYINVSFSHNYANHAPFLDLILLRISLEDDVLRTTPITKEIKQALFQLYHDKSPCPNVFNPARFQDFWHLCGDDIFHAPCSWLERGFFLTILNIETNICFIPKCENLESIKDFRLIALYNVLYKMMAKLLANRFKSCLDKWVSTQQSAYISKEDRLRYWSYFSIDYSLYEEESKGLARWTSS